MPSPLDALFEGDPQEWINALAPYQREPIEDLLGRGLSYESIADNWLTASAENTFRFGTENRAGDTNVFRDKLLFEIEEFLCGSERYEKERAGLFGEKSSMTTYVISALSVAIAPSLGVTATFLVPIIALTLASFGKVTVNAWCGTRKLLRTQAVAAPPA